MADISRAAKLPGYNPTTPLREGIHKAVTWSLEWWGKQGK